MTTFLTGKSLPRRTLLKGFGASLALPLLDAMIPPGLSARRKLARILGPNRAGDGSWAKRGQASS